MLYPLANVQVTVGDKTLDVKAAVSDTLLVDVLLGTDVKELPELLHQRSKEERVHSDLDPMAVETRAQSKKEAEEEVAHQQMEQDCGVSPSSTEEDLWMTTFDDALFEAGNSKTKRVGARNAGTDMLIPEGLSHVEPEEPPGMTGINYSHPLQFSAGEMKSLQEADNSLDTIKVAAKGHPCTAGVGFFQKQGLLYRLWTPPRREGPSMAVEQLVLPVKCRKEVLQLTHSIPLSGHLGKEKTARRILQRFYWPTLYQDVAEYCQTCEHCQKASLQKGRCAPMIPLPVIEDPFSRVAMDIIGSLPKSRSGKRYVLVICDYATRYPEAIPLRYIDSGHIAEELVNVFSRVGVPKEILMDQGGNFTSELLRELYQLLHIHSIRITLPPSNRRACEVF